MFILKIGHQPGVYVPLRALFLVCDSGRRFINGYEHYLVAFSFKTCHQIKRISPDKKRIRRMKNGQESFEHVQNLSPNKTDIA